MEPSRLRGASAGAGEDAAPPGSAGDGVETRREGVGRDAYATYCALVGGVNHRGDPCPPWGELPGTIQRAWSGAAARAGDVASSEHVARRDPLDDPPEGLGDAQIAVWRRYLGAP